MFARRIALAAGSALCLALLSACSGAPSPAPATTAPASPASAPASASVSAPSGTGADAATLTLKLADTSLGSVLVDGKGMTLYLFTKDSPNTSACSGQCLVAWPPLVGKPTAGSGVDDSKLGSFVRTDGSTQATYNGWPLYYWKGDTKAGDVSGQNVSGVWFVLNHDGEPVKK
jgi:predicted lipoprotein with Yx(FWY)xxD motif